jgi:hypothetical protein
MAPLAAMPGASLWEVANAEVEIARAKAADSVISCFMNVSGGMKVRSHAKGAAVGGIGAHAAPRRQGEQAPAAAPRRAASTGR